MNELVEVIGEVHFREVFSTLLKQELRVETSNELLMNREFFTRKIIDNCFFFRKKPSEELLYSVFD